MILTDCPELYQEPTILPPMTVDKGKPGRARTVTTMVYSVFLGAI